jgi:hypothetical protein
VPPSLGFMSIFTAIIALCLSIVGTCVMRNYRTPEHHAFFLGLSLMMSMVCFLMSVASGGGLNCSSSASSGAQAAFCAFTIFLGFLYLIFTVCLYRWRGNVVTRQSVSSPGDEAAEQATTNEGIDEGVELPRTPSMDSQNVRMV